MVATTTDELEQQMDSTGIDREHQGILKLDEDILILFDEGHWRIDEETLKTIVDQAGLTEEIQQ